MSLFLLGVLFGALATASLALALIHVLGLLLVRWVAASL